MSATSAPFGLRPVFHPSGLDRAAALANVIESGYNTDLFKGQIVKLDPATGYIIRGTASDPFFGVFNGVEWTDTTGRRRVSNTWPASTAYQTGSLIAYIWNDPAIVYEIQASGSLAQNTSFAASFDVSNVNNGSTTTGLSAMTLDTSAASANNSKQFRVVDIAPYPGNDWGDAYTIVRVQATELQYQGIGTGAATIYPVAVNT